MSLLTNILVIGIAVFLLGLCVFVHELGHFLAAKRRGLHVERFSIGFGPAVMQRTRDGVEYRLSAIPFGGYVALPQLVDMGRLEGGERRDPDSLPAISYADKMIVSVAGAVFNLIFALLLACVLWVTGQEVVASTEVDSVAEEIVNAEGETVPGPAHEAGIRPGDVILRVDGQRVRNWRAIDNALLTGTGRGPEGQPAATVTVRRGDSTQTFTVHPELISVGTDAIRSIGIRPDTELVVRRIQDGMPAETAGLRPGDTLVALDGKTIKSSSFLQVTLAQHEGGPMDLTVRRDGEQRTFSMEPTPVEGADGPKFGFVYGYRPETETVHRNPVEQMAAMGRTIKDTLVALVHPGSNVAPKNMSGPVGIVHGLSALARVGAIQAIWFLAFINVNLAIVNLLPIPVLDGGHMLFATIAKVRGRPLPRKFLETTQGAFMALLLAFMLYLTFFDIGRVTHGMGSGNDGSEPGAPQEGPTSGEDPAQEERPASRDPAD